MTQPRRKGKLSAGSGRANGPQRRITRPPPTGTPTPTMESCTTRAAFATTLLAGGHSRRMGQDKAALVIDEQPLWQRQLQLLRRLRPSGCAVACRRAQGLHLQGAQDIAWLHDPEPCNEGPMGAIVRALEWFFPLPVLVLAVDLPAMTLPTLEAIGIDPSCGCLPSIDQRFEPAASLYTAAMLPILQEHLRAGQRRLQLALAECAALQLARVWPIPAAMRRDFLNVNSAPDWQAALPHLGAANKVKLDCAPPPAP